MRCSFARVRLPFLSKIRATGGLFLSPDYD
jgi:hypothetical protein